MAGPSREVVVTGVGCVGPLGGDRETVWRRLLAGEKGLRRLTPDDFRGLPLGESPGFPLIGGPAAPADATGGEPLVGLVLQAAHEAAGHAGLTPGAFDPTRAGCVVGTSKGGLFTFARAWRNPADPSALLSDAFPHAASSAVARRLGLEGPCSSPVAACATGLMCLLRAADLIRDGACDLVFAGGADASLHSAVLGSFRRMGVLAADRDDPGEACRPFSVDRDGFAVGEGAAVLVLERRDHAEARGARGLAALAAGAAFSDPAGLTALDPRGEPLRHAVLETLARAGLAAADVGHVNLHGTGTRANDLAEAAALRAALGPRLDSTPCVALKGALGHLLGAAGALEAAATVLAIRDGRLPPTATLTDPDPECRLPVARSAAAVRGCGLKVSLGFGGHVAAACFTPP